MILYDDKYLKPMLLSERDKPFNDPHYLFEIKFDGVRATVFVEPGKIDIRNKRGLSIKDKYPELLAMQKMVKHQCIFDGEIIVIANGKPSFTKVMERALLKNKKRIDYLKEQQPVTFICFDIIYRDKDLTSMPLLKRKKILDKYQDTTFFVKTRYFLNDGVALFEAIKKQDLEGIVAKEINSSYLIGKRTQNWIKIKNFKDEDLYIGGFFENKDNVVASLALGRWINKQLIYVGNVTIGKRNKEYALIKKHKTLNKTPFTDFDDPTFTYLEPTLKCTVSFTEKTKTNKLRHPTYKGLKLNE